MICLCPLLRFLFLVVSWLTGHPSLRLPPESGRKEIARATWDNLVAVVATGDWWNNAINHPCGNSFYTIKKGDLGNGLLLFYHVLPILYSYHSGRFIFIVNLGLINPSPKGRYLGRRFCYASWCIPSGWLILWHYGGVRVYQKSGLMHSACETQCSGDIANLY